MRHALMPFIVLAMCSGCGNRRPLSETAITAQAVWLADLGRELAKPDEDGRAATEVYAAIAKKYEELDSPSAARFYNLGNARFLACQLPEALLAYRHGLRLDTNDAGLRENLDFARSLVPYPPGTHGRPEVSAWPAWLHRPSPVQVLGAALLLYALTCALLTRWTMTRRRPLLGQALVVFSLAAVGGLYWVHLESARAWEQEHPLVVIREDKLPLRKGNGPSYPANPDLPMLYRGMEARKLHERGPWLQIEFASGEVGWVETAAVLIDTP